MIKITVVDDRFVVTDGIDEVRNLGIGMYVKSMSAYVLDIAEVAYLIYTNSGILIANGKELTVEDLFTNYSRSPNDWIKFVVLYDLRSRGRRAKAGFSDNSLIFERGSRYIVYVTEENAPITSNELVNWVESALSKGYEPLLAIVDAHGDVTYYELLNVRVNELREVMER